MRGVNGKEEKRGSGLVKLSDATEFVWVDKFERGTADELVGFKAWKG